MWPSLRSNPATRDIAWLWNDSQAHGHFDIARHGHSEASYREHGIAMGTAVRDKLYKSLPLLGDGAPTELLAQLLAFVSEEDIAFEKDWLDRMPGSKPPEPGGTARSVAGWDRLPDRLRMASYDLTLRPDRIRELLDALTNALRSKDALDELAREMGTSPKIASDLQNMAIQFVEEAQQHSAVRWLVRAARVLQPTNEKLIAFEARHFARCFDPGGEGTADQVRRLDELIGIIGDLGDHATSAVTDALEAATGRIAPPWDVVQMSDRVNRAGLICLVAEQNGTKPPPLFRFIQEMQNRTPNEAVRARLEQWLKTVAGPMAVEISQIPMAVRPAPAKPRYVMVRVRPIELSEGYEVNAWLWVDSEPREVWSTSCRNLDELRDALAAELERPAQPLVRDLREVANDKITYEFILPRDLIDAEVDQWEIGVDGLPLGTVHRVVVRSYERIYAMPDRGWTKKWNVWQSRAAISAVWFDPSRDRMDKRFKLKLLPENVVVMASAGPFPSGRLADDPLTTGLRMGVPIIVWPRRPSGPGTRAQIEALLQHLGDDGHDVCAALLHMRTGAEAEEAACLHTALLWDDPLRCPPDCHPFEDVPTA
jgi:hypothetical protein